MADRVHYRPNATVEREMVKLGLAGTEGAAHQLLLKLRTTLPRVYEAFLAAAALDRLAWFDQPGEVVKARRPLLPLRDALDRKARVDGLEDGELTALAQRLDDPQQARTTLRHALREQAAAQDLVASICATHGWTL